MPAENRLRRFVVRSASGGRVTVIRLAGAGAGAGSEWTHSGGLDVLADHLKVRGRWHRYPDGGEEAWNKPPGGDTDTIARSDPA